MLKNIEIWIYAKPLGTSVFRASQSIMFSLSVLFKNESNVQILLTLPQRYVATAYKNEENIFTTTKKKFRLKTAH